MMRPFHLRGPWPLAFVVVLAMAVGYAPSAEAQLAADALGEWQKERKDAALADKAKRAAAEQEGARTSVEGRLARALSRFEVQPGALSGDDKQRLSMKPEVTADEPPAAELTKVFAALQAFEGNDQRLCVVSPGGSTTERSYQNAAWPSVVRAFGVTWSALRSTRRIDLKIEGKVLRLERGDVSATLFKRLWASFKVGSRATLRLSHRVRLGEVELEVRTSEGERLRLPARIVGAKNKIKIHPEARWLLDGKAVARPRLSRPWERWLLYLVATKGAVAMSDARRGEDFPIDEKVYPSLLRRSVHALGKERAWLGQGLVAVGVKRNAQRSSGRCALTLRYSQIASWPRAVGPLREAQWRRLKEFVVDDPKLPRFGVSYKNAPSCGQEVVIGGKQRPKPKRRAPVRWQDPELPVKKSTKPVVASVRRWHIDAGAALMSRGDHLGGVVKSGLSPLLHLNIGYGTGLRGRLAVQSTPGALQVALGGAGFSDTRLMAGVGYAFLPAPAFEIEPQLMAGIAIHSLSYNPALNSVDPAGLVGLTMRYYFAQHVGLHAGGGAQFSTFPVEDFEADGDLVSGSVISPVSGYFVGGLSFGF